jgi:hypothetical protein
MMMMMMIEGQTDRHFLLQEGKNGSPGRLSRFGSVEYPRILSVNADSLSLSRRTENQKLNLRSSSLIRTDDSLSS